ncbi:MAG: hypothetical protein OEP95_04660 [Myxococcales bacterium]|nr:hypothetical protein [Myxococcales bacterium]
MRILRILALGVAVLAVVGAGMGIAARFSDGPLAVFPGGAFRSGEWVDAPIVDWSFAADVETLELQLEGDKTARTTWILVHDGVAYIPCSLGFPPGKTWHERAVKDGRAILRHEGRRYPVQLERTEDDAAITALASVVENKYGAAPPSDETWFFALSSRAR